MISVAFCPFSHILNHIWPVIFRWHSKRPEENRAGPTKYNQDKTEIAIYPIVPTCFRRSQPKGRAKQLFNQISGIRST